MCLCKIILFVEWKELEKKEKELEEVQEVDGGKQQEKVIKDKAKEVQKKITVLKEDRLLYNRDSLNLEDYSRILNFQLYYL